MSASEVLGGSAGRVYAGPRVRVRRGRTGKFPVATRRRVSIEKTHRANWLESCVAFPRGCAGRGELWTYRLRGHPGPRGRWSGRPRVESGTARAARELPESTYRHVVQLQRGQSILLEPVEADCRGKRRSGRQCWELHVITGRADRLGFSGAEPLNAPAACDASAFLYSCCPPTASCSCSILVLDIPTIAFLFTSHNRENV